MIACHQRSSLGSIGPRKRVVAHVGDEQVIRLEAVVGLLHLQERLHQQSGAEEQEERHGDLGDH